MRTRMFPLDDYIPDWFDSGVDHICHSSRSKINRCGVILSGERKKSCALSAYFHEIKGGSINFKNSIKRSEEAFLREVRKFKVSQWNPPELKSPQDLEPVCTLFLRKSNGTKNQEKKYKEKLFHCDLLFHSIYINAKEIKKKSRVS